jgi:hypothetical protein
MACSGVVYPILTYFLLEDSQTDISQNKTHSRAVTIIDQFILQELGEKYVDISIVKHITICDSLSINKTKAP